MGYVVKKVWHLLNGDIILHPIYREDGLLLINHYTKLSENLIDYIYKKLGNDTRVIVASDDGSMKEFEVNKEYKSVEFISDLKEIFLEHKHALRCEFLELNHFLDQRVAIYQTNDVGNEVIVENTIKKVRFSTPFWDDLENEFENDRLNERVKKLKRIILVRLSDEDTYELLEEMKNYNNILYNHAINTMAMSLLLGISIEMSDRNLEDLAIATLFSDIGYTKIPKIEFLRYLSSGEATPATKEHIKYSIEILSTIKNFNLKSIIMGILDHHESIDGTGFPNNKKGNEISLFGKIINIAQEYDSMAGGYKNDRIISPSYALQSLWDMRGKQIDFYIMYSHILRSFRFKIGQKVLLNNGQQGVIVGHENFTDEPYKPYVRLMNKELINIYRNDHIRIVRHLKNEN